MGLLQPLNFQVSEVRQLPGINGERYDCGARILGDLNSHAHPGIRVTVVGVNVPDSQGHLTEGSFIQRGTGRDGL